MYGISWKVPLADNTHCPPLLIVNFHHEQRPHGMISWDLRRRPSPAHRIPSHNAEPKPSQ